MQDNPPAIPEEPGKPLFWAGLAVAVAEPLLALAAVLGALLVAAGLRALIVGVQAPLSIGWTLAAMTLQAVLLAWAGAALRRRHGIEDPATRADTKTLLLAVAGGPAVFATSMVVALATRAVGVEVQEQAWVTAQLADRSTAWLLAPWMVLLAPWAEEVFFRGYMMRRVGLAGGATAGVLVSAATFAAIHWNPSGLAVYFAMGCALALLYRRGGLAVAVAAHAGHNGLVLALSLAAAPPPG